MILKLKVQFADDLLIKLSKELGLKTSVDGNNDPTLSEVEGFLEADMERLLIDNYSGILEKMYLRTLDEKYKRIASESSKNIREKMARAITHQVGD